MMEEAQKSFCRIAVCDDNSEDIIMLTEMLKQICREEGIRAKISSFEDGSDLTQEVNEIEFDLIFLDVMMPGMDGMELAENLRQNKYNGKLVFVSVNREMALRGYEVGADRYLAKPLDEEKLREAVLFCLSDIKKREEILLPMKGGQQRIFIGKVMYVETRGRGCILVQEKEKWNTSRKISELEEFLEEYNFIKIHQSYLVNLDYVRTLRPGGVELLNGEILPLSKYRAQSVRKVFVEYLEN